MSEMQLSAQMAEDVKKAIAAHDPRANDELISVQYMAALTGLVVGELENMPMGQKQDVMGQLAQFAASVMEDVERSREERAQPQEEAFGIWKPGQN